ncbi:hypothetical protein N9917_00425 [Deltaproteobacteria bacterium]|nr:hypothetical protein [Deltaproteobacteria bacterium]
MAEDIPMRTVPSSLRVAHRFLLRKCADDDDHKAALSVWSKYIKKTLPGTWGRRFENDYGHYTDWSFQCPVDAWLSSHALTLHGTLKIEDNLGRVSFWLDKVAGHDKKMADAVWKRMSRGVRFPAHYFYTTGDGVVDPSVARKAAAHFEGAIEGWSQEVVSILHHTLDPLPLQPPD